WDVVRVVQNDEQVREVYLAQDETDDRHEDVIDEGGDDGAECRADNDTDREIDDISFDREVSEFLEHGHWETLVCCPLAYVAAPRGDVLQSNRFALPRESCSSRRNAMVRLSVNLPATSLQRIVP